MLWKKFHVTGNPSRIRVSCSTQVYHCRNKLVDKTQRKSVSSTLTTKSARENILPTESNEFHTDLQEMTKNMRNNCGQQLYRYITRVITVERLRSVEQKSVRWVHAPLPVLVSSLSTLSSHRLWPNWNDKFPVQVCIILYSPLAAIKIVIDRIEQPLANTLAGRN